MGNPLYLNVDTLFLRLQTTMHTQWNDFEDFVLPWATWQVLGLLLILIINVLKGRGTVRVLNVKETARWIRPLFTSCFQFSVLRLLPEALLLNEHSHWADAVFQSSYGEQHSRLRHSPSSQETHKVIKETENTLRIIFRRKPLLPKWIHIQILDLSPGSSERNPLPAGAGGRWERAEGPKGGDRPSKNMQDLETWEWPGISSFLEIPQ